MMTADAETLAERVQPRNEPDDVAAFGARTHCATLPMIGSCPDLPEDFRRSHHGSRLLVVPVDGREEAYTLTEAQQAEYSDEHWNLARLDRGALDTLEPAPLQQPVSTARRPRMRDLDTERVPRSRRAKVDAELDRPLTWLPQRADGAPGTIRDEVTAGHIVGKHIESGQPFLTRTSIPEDSSRAREDSSHKSIGVSKSLYACLE